MSIGLITQQIQNQRTRLLERGVTHVAVFGSRARGDAKPQSDLDVLLDIQDGTSFSLFDIVRIEAMLSEATGLPANVVLRRGLKSGFYESIKPDVRSVF